MIKDFRSYEARVEQLNACIPNIFDFESYLYVGASKNRTSFLEFLLGKQVFVFEIYDPNIKELKERYKDYKFILGDVRNVDSYFDEKSIDIVIWFHGPEHIRFDEIPIVLSKLERIAKHLVVLGCPWGKYEQGIWDGNINETHLCSLYPEDFLCWKYNINTLCEGDVMGSNILAWRVL